MANSTQIFYYILLALVFIGGLNWGLYAINPSYNVVEAIFGAGSVFAKIIFYLVAIAAIAAVVMSFTNNNVIFIQ